MAEEKDRQDQFTELDERVYALIAAAQRQGASGVGMLEVSAELDISPDEAVAALERLKAAGKLKKRMW